MVRIITLLLSVLLFATSANAGLLDFGGDQGGNQGGGDQGSMDLNVRDGFSLEQAMNWSDCFDFDLSFGFAVCPGWPIRGTITLNYSYWDLVALVEVVPDPWKSFLYDDSIYDFSSKSGDSVLAEVGLDTGIGGGYMNRKQTSEDSIGKSRLETHVWYVSDYSRFMTSADFLDACRSLTCKTEDWMGCLNSISSIANFEMSDEDQKSVDSVNSPEDGGEKGEGFTNAESGETCYEDGSCEGPIKNEYGSTVGYGETREAGNYGSGQEGTQDITTASGHSSREGSEGGGHSSNSQDTDSAMAANPGLGEGVGSGAFDEAIAMVDFVVYFSPIEIFITEIAHSLPIFVHPVFMTERHKDAMGYGGLYAPFFQAFADQDGGMIMSLLCAVQSGTLMADSVASTFGFGGEAVMGALTSVIGNRCVGSWGPLEPRLNTLGQGDIMIAAGLASVRGLNIAQNLERVHEKNFSNLKFNLDWPHQSSCNKVGTISRTWTSPVTEAATSMSSLSEAYDSLTDTSGYAETAGDVAGEALKQGGQVFTYWRKRSCQYWWTCKIWRGDTGGI